MLDTDFKKIKENIDYVNSLIESSMNNYDRVGFENKKVYSKLENFQGDLTRVSEFIRYMNKSTKDDFLKLADEGKFKCNKADIYLSCGRRLEAFVQTEHDEEPSWCIGRVEHETGRGYYFYNYDGDNVYLYEGMEVRVRV